MTDLDAAYIYVLVKGDRCKIGRSRMPRRRANAIGTAAGFDLKIHIAFPVAAFLASEVEKFAHATLNRQRIKGEWFCVDGDQAVSAVENAILEITRRRAIGPGNGLPRAIDCQSPEGRQILLTRLSALRVR